MLIGMGTRWGLISFVSCSTAACGIGASRGLILFDLLNFFPYFSYFSFSLFEYFFSFVFCIFATCAMGTSRGRHQQSSFPVFLQMQPCISGKSKSLFFPTLSGHLIIRWVHLWSTFTCAPHAMSIQNPQKREVHLCPLRLGQNGILETIWLLCKYAKITRWPRQNIFQKKFSILPVSEKPFEKKPEDATLEGLAIMKMQLKVNKYFNIKPTLKNTVFGFLKQSALKSFPFSLLIFLSM